MRKKKLLTFFWIFYIDLASVLCCITFRPTQEAEEVTAKPEENLNQPEVDEYGDDIVEDSNDSPYFPRHREGSVPLPARNRGESLVDRFKCSAPKQSFQRKKSYTGHSGAWRIIFKSYPEWQTS